METLAVVRAFEHCGPTSQLISSGSNTLIAGPHNYADGSGVVNLEIA